MRDNATAGLDLVTQPLGLQVMLVLMLLLILLLLLLLLSLFARAAVRSATFARSAALTAAAAAYATLGAAGRSRLLSGTRNAPSLIRIRAVNSSSERLLLILQ